MLKIQQTMPESKTALYCYVCTSLLFLAGCTYGIFFLEQYTRSSVTVDQPNGINAVLHRWDSEHYLHIASNGYSYSDEERGENIAFFPTYPVLIQAVSSVSRLPRPWSALLIAHASVIAALAVFSWYLRDRFTDSKIRHWSLVFMAMMPAGFFWRFAYSEATFLILIILAMYLMQRRSSLLMISLTIGLATATRPVGVALLVPFAIHLFQRHPKLGDFHIACWKFVPLSCWGILAFMAYQYFEFGEPLAFMKTQQHWRIRPQVEATEKLASFAALEPIWAAYRADSLWYWNRLESHSIPFLSLAFWNPIAFVGAAGLTYFGHRRRWLTMEETSLATGLLAIPFFTKGFDFCMLSQARFAAVAFPIYITSGHLAHSWPKWLRYAVVGFTAVLFFYFSARFAAGFQLI